MTDTCSTPFKILQDWYSKHPKTHSITSRIQFSIFYFQCHTRSSSVKLGSSVEPPLLETLPVSIRISPVSAELPLSCRMVRGDLQRFMVLSSRQNLPPKIKINLNARNLRVCFTGRQNSTIRLYVNISWEELLRVK